MTRPKYCPNCGEKLGDETNAAVHFEIQQPGGSTPEAGWDCYCKSCKWSGDILPDNEV